jgi:preprotein translocase subunit YajC
MSCLLSLLVLQAEPGAEPATSEGFKGFAEQNPGMMLVFLIGFIILMWYMLIGGPQRKQTREREAMLSSVRKGDRVQTIGGIHGKVSRVDKENQVVSVEVAKGVEIDFSQAAVSSISRPKGEGKAGDKKGG